MTENNNIIVQDPEGGRGRIEIAPEVLEILLGIAASQIDGVYEMRGTLANNINAWFGRVNRGKGVTVSVHEDQLTVDVYVYMDYGVSVPKVALDMQQALKDQLLYMTDLHLDMINVHVVGLIPQKNESKIDPDALFGDTAAETEDGAQN